MTDTRSRTRRPFAVNDAIAILSRTPATLDALLRGLPESWVTAHEGGETWSPFDVIGHLIHGEQTDWIPRARIVLAQGPSTAFTPFDRTAHQRARGANAPLEELIKEGFVKELYPR